MASTQVLCKAVMLLVVIAVVQTSELQQESVYKRAHGQNHTKIMVLLKNLQARMNRLETKQLIFLRGRDGRDGRDGKDGKDGVPGQNGKDGRDGIPGKCISCKDGRDGVPGKKGVPGLRGRPGRNGGRGPQGPRGDRGPAGVQYVRWGRTTCPSGVSLVYKGRIGGEGYHHPGGGTNYVCLTEVPKFRRYRDNFQGGGEMYGAEYQLRGSNPFTTSNLHNHDAPCAVCYVKTRSARLMIPATYECPAGWTREYHGYLMSEYYNHKHPSEFICVDQYPEKVPGTSANKNGALLHPVEGVCGSLPCSPFVQGRELTCAVCTR